MATPYDAPIPGASTYATAALGAKTAYQNALARINSKRQDTLRQFGYLGDVDPTSGTLSNLRVDPYNQYGGLQQMLRGNADAVQGARFAAEERGLHGGLAHKALSDVKYDFGNASQKLGTAFSGALGGFQDEQSQAAYQRDRALYEAELEAARLAIENQQFNPAGDSDGGGSTNDDPSGAPTITNVGSNNAATSTDSSGRPIFYTDGRWYYGDGTPAGQASGQTAARTLVSKAAPKPSVPYIHSAGAASAPAKTYTAAAKVAQAAAKKKKGGK